MKLETVDLVEKVTQQVHFNHSANKRRWKMI